jgi:hypothetical protein
MRISITSFSVVAALYAVQAFEAHRVLSSVPYSAATIAHSNSIGVCLDASRLNQCKERDAHKFTISIPSTMVRIFKIFLIYCHVSGVCVTSKTGSVLDDWIYWHLYNLS